ncbi:MAG: hypothetical protein E5W40_01630 [Mesorhizobium sp.]|nr:MAG: hypothetical protein E5W40_01630 [Mesorhizobium sp.]
MFGKFQSAPRSLVSFFQLAVCTQGVGEQRPSQRVRRISLDAALRHHERRPQIALVNILNLRTDCLNDGIIGRVAERFHSEFRDWCNVVQE